MKTRITVFFLLLLTVCFAQKKQAHFKSDIDFGNGTVFTTFLDVSVGKGHFTITSPKNADVRMFGGKARLGRIMGKSPKKGIILTIKGTQAADSLLGETTMPMFGKLTFKGAFSENSLSGEFSNQSESIGFLKGYQTAEEKADYAYLYPKIQATIRDNIYSATVLQTDEWKDFEKKTESLCHDTQDDIELFLGFNILAQELPFTHLSLLIAKDTADDEQPTGSAKTVVFEEKTQNTAYLSIKNFSTSKAELAAVLPGIVKNKKYDNLIIDLRDNSGGGIDAAFKLAQYIVTRDLDVGYFVTNKLPYSGYDANLFGNLPELQPRSTRDFTDELKTLPGVKLVFKKPSEQVFTGKLYVLTNAKTASTCEPIVYALKNNKMATIIGEKTYGGMLAASAFVVSGKYSLMVPIADFFTYDGVRLDKVGVTPDIETRSEDALAKALELISTNEKNN